MNANTNTRPSRIATLDGIFVFDERTGFYEPATDPAIAHPILLNIALVIGAWAIVGGIGYGAYRIFEALS